MVTSYNIVEFKVRRETIGDSNDYHWVCSFPIYRPTVIPCVIRKIGSGQRQTTTIARHVRPIRGDREVARNIEGTRFTYNPGRLPGGSSLLFQ